MLKIQKICYMDTDSVIGHVKTDGIYKDVGEDVETRSDTSNFEWDRTLPKGKNKRSNWINDWLIRWKDHERICWIKRKTYSDLKHNNNEDENSKGTKKRAMRKISGLQKLFRRSSH